MKYDSATRRARIQLTVLLAVFLLGLFATFVIGILTAPPEPPSPPAAGAPLQT